MLCLHLSALMTNNKLKYARLDSRSIAQGAAARGLIVVAGRLIKSHKKFHNLSVHCRICTD